MLHIGGMNLLDYFYTYKRFSAVICVCIAVLLPLCAQDGINGSVFGSLTDRPFGFDREYEAAEHDNDTDLLEWDAAEKNEVATEDRNDETHHKNAPSEPAAASKAEAGEQPGAAANQQDTKGGTGRTENLYSEFFLRSIHSLRKGHRFSAGVAGHGYVGMLQLESPIPMPYFELAVRSFSIGLYPLAALQSVFPKKNIPTLFLGAGSLTFGSFLKTAHFTGYSKISARYGGLTLPRQNFISASGTQKAVQYGIELYGSGWSGAFFASPEPKKQRMRYGLTGSWQMKPNRSDISLSLQYLTAFIPEVSRESKSDKPSKTSKTSTQTTVSGIKAVKGHATSISADAAPDADLHTAAEIDTAAAQQRYHKLFGLRFHFMHPIISFETTGLCSYAADKTVSGGVQAECDIWYRYAGIRTGTAYTAENAVSWDNTLQTQQLTAFMQPYFKAGIVSLHTLYALNMKETVRLHTGGAIIQIKHKVIRWSAEWDYRKSLHTVKTTLTCVSSPAWFKGTRWFESTSAGTALELQSKAVNPAIIKKYTVHANSVFCITQGVFCGINGTLSQSLSSDTSTEYPMPSLQHPIYSSAVFLQFKRNGIGKIHSGKLELTVKNTKPHFDVKIGYQVHLK